MTDWTNFADVRATYNSVDRVGTCYVFNVDGNNFRLIAGIDFKHHTVFIRKVMTHKQFDDGKWRDECGC